MRPSVTLAERARRDGAGPLLTFYDDATGERVELSGTTTLNWVAKATHLLVDELWLEPGEQVGLDLPLHWQTWVLALSCWSAGLVPAPGRADGAAAFTTPGSIPTAGQVVVCSLRPLGGRVVEPLPEGWRDFALEVPPQPDAFVPSASAAVVAPPPALPAGARVLVTELDLTRGLLAPLACGGSVVLVRHPRTDLADLCATERVTYTVGTTVAGLPGL